MKKNYLYAILSVLIWSTLAAVSKMMLSDLPSMQTLSIGAAFAFLFLLLINLKSGKLKQMKQYQKKDYALMGSLGLLGLFVYTALYYYGLTQLSSQDACILNYLWPMMLVLFSCLILKEKLTKIKVLAMLCSFLGIVLLSAGNSGSKSGGAVLGMLSCIGAAACYGLFSVLNKKANYDQQISMMIGWFLVAIASLGFGLFTEQWIMLQPAQWLGMLWLGIATNALAYLFWALSLQGIENTAKIANLAYLTPFLSLVVSFVLLGETISFRALAALVFIVGGVLLQSLCEGKKPPMDKGQL